MHKYLFVSITWKVKVLVTQLCPTLCDPTGCRLPGSSAHGILQARILEWVAIPFSRGSCCPRDQTQVSCVASRFFTIWVNREAPWLIHNKFSVNEVEYFETYIDRLKEIRGSMWLEFIAISRGQCFRYIMTTVVIITWFHWNKWINCFPCGSLVNTLPAVQETLVQFLGWKDPLERDSTHSTILGLPLCGSAGKESTCNAGDLGSSLGWEDPLEKGTATHTSILA